jgi:hypothetical protein
MNRKPIPAARTQTLLRPLLTVMVALFTAFPGGGLAPATAAEAIAAEDDPRQYLLFVEEFTGSCVARSGVQVLVKNTHPTRGLRVWLDRYHAGTGTGDRSRTDLPPASAPEPLGCSRNNNAPQEWRVVRAAFIN